jgi:hypothetical protein
VAYFKLRILNFPIETEETHAEPNFLYPDPGPPKYEVAVLITGHDFPSPEMAFHVDAGV